MELFGGAGHSKEIAKRISSNGMLIGIDRDQEALKAAQNNLKEFHNIKYVHDNHDNIKNILEKLNIEKVDGILLDLGVSSYQLDERNRGFRTTEKGGLKNKPPFLHLFYFYITVLLFLISFARDCHISTFYTTLVFFNSAFKYKDYLVKLILKNI